MAIISSNYRNAILALALVCGVQHSAAFISPASRGVTHQQQGSFLTPIVSGSSFVSRPQRSMSRSSRAASSALRMSSEEFSEATYTEAAWGAIAALTKAADYYEASTIEAPILVDILLSPSKHGAGEDAEAAKRVAEKILTGAGANVKDVRSALEKFLAKQPKVSGQANKMLGYSLQKVLETARTIKGQLQVRYVTTG